MKVIPAKWIPRLSPVHGGAAEAAGAGAGFPPILEHLLRQRGLLSDGDLETFLRPRLKDLSDPFLLPDMELAVGRIFRAIDAGEKICIYGDYDVDGVTSIALMRRVLRAYGAEPRLFIPKRSSEGYSLSAAALERCMREGDRPDLMITVDCGTAAVEEIASLSEQGVEVVVVDHHEPAPHGLPNCVAVVNPKRSNHLTYLCAAGVVFKLAHALLKTRPLDGFDLRDVIDLVAVATIADIVPLIGENRILVCHGLRRLPKTPNAGLWALQKVTGMDGAATSMDVGFRIGPRLNAAGRMDVPEDALEMLLTDDGAHAARLAEKLDGYNRERQRHEQQMRTEALAMLGEGFNPGDDPVIVLGSRSWHPGVVGIVASRLMRQFHKPTFIIAIDSNGVGKGSGRSIEGISLVQAIQACQGHLLAGGGHDMAAGLSIAESSITAFRRSFGDYVRSASNSEQRLPRLYVDAEVDFDDLSLEFLDSYELLQPFGSSNPQPIFMSRQVYLSEAPQRLKNNHLRFFLRQGYTERDAIFFGGGERTLPEPPWDIAFTIDRNTFRGKTSLQIIVQDVRAAGVQS
jgi:single-stranded-DNA-specific exonuclease